MKKVLLTTALVSFAIIDPCAFADPSASEFDFENGARKSLIAKPDVDLFESDLDRRKEIADLPQNGAVKQKATTYDILGSFDAEDPKAFVKVSEKPQARLFTPEELETYVNQVLAQRTLAAKIESGEIILAHDPDYNWKMAKRAAGTAFNVGWDVASPLVGAAALRIIGDVALKYAAPHLANGAGKAAAAAASKVNSWWTWVDPTGTADKFVRGAASTTAEGETYRDLGTMMGYVEKYGYPAAQTAYRAATTVASGVKTVATTAYSAAKSACSWASNWWNGSTSSSQATA